MRRFPIGIYAIDDAKHLSDLREHGFDTFYSGIREPEALDRLAIAAKRLGMGMIAQPDDVMKGPRTVTRDWPVAAWYLQDEPDVLKTKPKALASLSDRTRRWDPDRLQTFAIGQGAPAQKYGHVADVLMLDWYPVPHLDLDSVAEHIDRARSFLPEDKPLWMVVQAFDWRQFPSRNSRKSRIGRFPNHSEIRFMSYLSIVHGARGLFYYTFRVRGGRVLSDTPEQWQAVTRVVHEIKSLQPILERGREIPLPFQVKGKSLEGRALRHGGRDYVILLNRSKSPAPLPKEFLESNWRPLFEVRRSPKDFLFETRGSWMLPPYRVIVFEGRWRLWR
ncbi:hypothetical protein ACFL2T_00045 [Elusimicrobiota bacterium]